jgi:hypothetical protein
MKSVALLPRATLLPTGLWIFLGWYFVEKPVQILKRSAEYALALGEVFSFMFLLRTLLKPWKNIVDTYPTKGLQIGLIFEVLTLNVISRIIGMLFRLVTFCIGVALEILLVAGSLFLITIWIIAPAIWAAELLYLFTIL